MTSTRKRTTAKTKPEMRLRLVPSGPPPVPCAPGELEPELLAFIRAVAEADAEADHRAALQAAAERRRNPEEAPSDKP
jgi:hypothetical protein